MTIEFQTRTDVLEMAVDKIKSLKQENEVLKVKIDKLPQPGKCACWSHDGHVIPHFCSNYRRRDRAVW